jgi:tetratricopeptide (TPR) repeat protein
MMNPAPTPATLQAMHAASALLQTGQFSEARKVLEDITRAQPDFAEAQRLLAGALLALGDRVGAEALLRAAAAKHPHWAPLQVALGELLVENGDLATAETALRRGYTEGGARYPRAALALTRVLLRLDRAQEAHTVIAPLAEHADANPETIIEHARALLALKRNDAAITAYRRVVAAAPNDGMAAARLAGALVAAEQFSEARQWVQRALAAGVDQAEAWFIAGSAAAGEDRYDEAQAAFSTACERNPDYLDAQREHAQLIWMRSGDMTRATALLDARLRERPAAHDLLAIKAGLYLSAGDQPGALALIEPAAHQADATPMLLLTACEAALKTDATLAVEFAERALRAQPGNPAALGALGNALLGSGRAQDAQRLAQDALHERPNDQGFIALLATAQRLGGDDSYRQTDDYAGLVHAWMLDTPPGWPDLPSYLADLAASLRRLHTLRTHPLYQSLRGGTQTTQNLKYSEEPAIRAFFVAIDGPIRRHMQAIGSGNDPTRRRNTGNYKIAGIWSVQLQPDGYHTDHVHPEGWLSSACYIDLPRAIERNHEGWLKFGQPGVPTTPALAPEHFIQPKPGLLALFPSHMWHGTVPFHGEGTRLTIAFDVVPT